jgi:lipopolysaccharide transport system permease protein
MEELIISAEREEKNYWRDLWSYRELLFFLAWRDILVRYKQTTVGVAWAIIVPLINIVIVTVIFQKVAGLPSNGIPSFLFVGGGTLLWQLFANAFSGSGNSIIGNSNLISKVYFPRLLVTAAPLAVGLVDYTISLAILGVMMVWYQFIPDFRILAAPLFIILALTASLGAGLWIAALTVKYRDFRFIAPFIVQAGMLISPLGYSSDRFPGFLRLLYSMNPMVGAIDGFRWAVFRGAVPLYWPELIISICTSALLLTTAVIHFRKTEKSFADII